MSETLTSPTDVPAASSRRPEDSESPPASDSSGAADGDFKSPALPELRSSTLDLAEVERLLRDIEACAQITEIIPKQSAQGYAPETGTLTLEDARELLRARAVRGVQIRYCHDGTDWWDTLMVTGENFRLVRIQHVFEKTAGSGVL